MNTSGVAGLPARVAAIAFAALLTSGSITPAAGQIPELPKLGPEHDVLKLGVGTWDAVVEINPGPDVPTQSSRAVETNALGCAGFCLIGEFKGEIMPGVPFSGQGLTTWDPAKRKYVGAFIDSLSPGLSASEATWDPKSKKSSGWIEVPNPADGTTLRLRSVVEHTADGKRVLTTFMPGADGQEWLHLRITYTRRK